MALEVEEPRSSHGKISPLLKSTPSSTLKRGLFERLSRYARQMTQEGLDVLTGEDNVPCHTSTASKELRYLLWQVRGSTIRPLL